MGGIDESEMILGSCFWANYAARALGRGKEGTWHRLSSLAFGA